MTAAAKRWQVHIAGWARSGLSCKEYAAQVGVHPGTLAAWKSKLRQAGGAVQTFVEVSEPRSRPSRTPASSSSSSAARFIACAAWSRPRR